MGGDTSSFKLNVDGLAGHSFTDITILPYDSLYVFVSATIDPTTNRLPFLVSDSITFLYNGNRRSVQLMAYGQNAFILKNLHVRADTTFTNELPIVILNALTVDAGATLTVNPASKLYFHADAPFIVNGRLRVNGGPGQQQVIFSGDRLDPVYNNLPAAWPGILFSAASFGNQLNYATIKNGYQGIVSLSSVRDALILNQCIIDNIYTYGIAGFSATISATNCLITNCGYNVLCTGGDYSFTHCTIAAIGNFYVAHKFAAVTLTNADEQNNILPLRASFNNCIIYGEGGSSDNELSIIKQGTPGPADFSIVFKNVLYKGKLTPFGAETNSLQNVPPLFDSINAFKGYYNFHLQPTSPAINAGFITPVSVDLEGNSRGGSSGNPDLGCYEQ